MDRGADCFKRYVKIVALDVGFVRHVLLSFATLEAMNRSQLAGSIRG